MYEGRPFQELMDTQMEEWQQHELEYHHSQMSDYSPWLNAQGTSLHGQIIKEIVNRGGIED
ncbi:hypothetical protein SY83_02810 [Paenibacillus swuensis]|uniref:Uncharacterized protein n=1 Tax=Paenibacillus swuensis TaxID=1178515 RepID=A0A172TEG8_9BACL|nr:hypothetical protein [Paenibacillus swuensis]ANE45431.1 hypothetical protein SY83_02810 [Paenibacillus swuensis]